MSMKLHMRREHLSKLWSNPTLRVQGRGTQCTKDHFEKISYNKQSLRFLLKVCTVLSCVLFLTVTFLTSRVCHFEICDGRWQDQIQFFFTSNKSNNKLLLNKTGTALPHCPSHPYLFHDCIQGPLWQIFFCLYFLNIRKVVKVHSFCKQFCTRILFP